MLSGKADSAVYSNACTLCHGKCAIVGGISRILKIFCRSSNTLSCCCIHSVSTVERNQECYTGRNCITTRRKGRIVHKDKRLCRACCSICRCCIEIVKEVARSNLIVIKLTHAQQTGANRFLCSTTHCKPRSTATNSKRRFNGHILCRNKGICCCSRKNLTTIIGPTKEY